MSLRFSSPIQSTSLRNAKSSSSALWLWSSVMLWTPPGKLYFLAKCPFLWHGLHSASRALHSVLECFFNCPHPLHSLVLVFILSLNVSAIFFWIDSFCPCWFSILCRTGCCLFYCLTLSHFGHSFFQLSLHPAVGSLIMLHLVCPQLCNPLWAHLSMRKTLSIRQTSALLLWRTPHSSQALGTSGWSALYRIWHSSWSHNGP